MGIKERKAREKEHRRSSILDAAERVFFSKNRGNPTMEDVAKEAELSKGALYLYFKNKEELFIGIILRAILIMRGMFESALKKKLNGLEKLNAISKAYIEFFNKYPDYFNSIMYFESKQIKGEAEDSILAVAYKESDYNIGMVREAIKEGIMDGSIKKNVQALPTALVLWGQISGLMQLISTKGEGIHKIYNIEQNELIHTYFEMLNISLAEN